jgi:negative regulator of flagellin synthesis FlgM
MKVTNQSQNQLQNVSAKKSDKAKGTSGDLKKLPSSGAEALGATEVAMSSKARDLQKIKDVAIGSSPDVDEAKVAKYQKLIDSGNYKVDAKGLADKLVDEQLKMSSSDTE